jgi:rRNA-processing protein FCF1
MAQENRKRCIVILDTNFLFVPFYFKIDIFKELELEIPGVKEFIIPSTVIEELKRIKNSKPVLDYLNLYQNKIKIVNVPEKGADSSIIYLVKEILKKSPESKVYVATGDRRLRKILSGLGARLIYVRSGKRLEIED